MTVDPKTSGLDGLRELSARATRGPWWLKENYIRCGNVDIRYQSVCGPLRPDLDLLGLAEVTAQDGDDMGQANADLITASVNLVRDLLSDEGIERMTRAHCLDRNACPGCLSAGKCIGEAPNMFSMRAAVASLMTGGGA